jgi:hypothetical protein
MTMSDLLAESAKRRSLVESEVPRRLPLGEDEVSAATDFVLEHPDFTSYHLLFALKDRAESRYASIPARVRAEVLCSALANLTYLNDWGHLAVVPKAGPAMRALVATGDAALRCLGPMLEDGRHAPFFGSADATIASQYRRADFAYHAAASILGEKPAFAPSAEQRDREIAALAERIH